MVLHIIAFSIQLFIFTSTCLTYKARKIDNFLIIWTFIFILYEDFQIVWNLCKLYWN